MNQIHEKHNVFSCRLETFNNYKGLSNILQLSRLGFIHVGNNIICCLNCKKQFIIWNQDEEFWRKHKETLCLYINQSYNIHTTLSAVEIDEYIGKWLEKNFIIDLLKTESISYIKQLLKEFLSIKGELSTLRLFKEFYMFKNKFERNNHL